ncbi:MAG: hypothetical protein RJA29_2134, partial [Pseudomonadota bacterium]
MLLVRKTRYTRCPAMTPRPCDE